MIIINIYFIIAILVYLLIQFSYSDQLFLLIEGIHILNFSILIFIYSLYNNIYFLIIAFLLFLLIVFELILLVLYNIKYYGICVISL